MNAEQRAAGERRGGRLQLCPCLGVPVYWCTLWAEDTCPCWVYADTFKLSTVCNLKIHVCCGGQTQAQGAPDPELDEDDELECLEVTPPNSSLQCPVPKPLLGFCCLGPAVRQRVM